uniref:FAR1 domain-containing protein n=1 Tax=Elaeophora elaphi TaxID=1147741 RepID=A0A0R3RMH3_9BILA
MSSAEQTKEAPAQLSTKTPHYAKEAINAHVKDAMIIQEKVINELNLSIQTDSFNVAAELQVRKIENGKGNAVETSTKTIMKQTKNGMQTSSIGNNTHSINEESEITALGNGSIRNKRKPTFVRHITRRCVFSLKEVLLENNIEQNENKTGRAVQEYFDESDEEPVNLSNKNGQWQVLNKQSDQAISSEQHCEENSDKRNGKGVMISSSSTKRKRIDSELPNLNPRYGTRTFSTFAPEEQEELRREASNIHAGAKFQSFDEFAKYLEAYKIVNNCPYRKGSSEYLRDGEGCIIERFKYKYMVLQCAYFGKPRKRGGGRRPNQVYLPSECQARVRLIADTINGYLQISSFHEKHKNHGMTERDYLRVVNKKRRNLVGKFMDS